MSRNRGKPLADEELRYWPTELETRSDGPLRRIGGLGVPYGQRSRLLPGGFYEVVEPRSMAKTLGDKLDVVCRMEHHPEWLLATTESGSLRLTDDPAVGLSYEADLPNTGAGRDCYELVNSGRIKYSSMAFIAIHDEFRSQGSTLTRHLTDIRLTEVSPVAQPGYLTTSTAVRSLARQVGEDPEDVEAVPTFRLQRPSLCHRHRWR
jgi:HK97 family phage prohead protease